MNLKCIMNSLYSYFSFSSGFSPNIRNNMEFVSPTALKNVSSVYKVHIFRDVLGSSPHPGCNRHHQDYATFFLRESRAKTLATGILGGPDPRYVRCSKYLPLTLGSSNPMGHHCSDIEVLKKVAIKKPTLIGKKMSMAFGTQMGEQKKRKFTDERSLRSFFLG